MKKIMIAAVTLLFSYSLSANDFSKEKEISKDKKTEDVFMLLEGEKTVFFYVHCRIRINSEGAREYVWCKETNAAGKEVYMDPKMYPPLPKE